MEWRAFASDKQRSQFTYVCPTEIISFSENADSFASMNTQVIGVSTDSHHTHLAWIKTPREEGGLGQVNIVSLSSYFASQFLFFVLTHRRHCPRIIFIIIALP